MHRSTTILHAKLKLVFSHVQVSKFATKNLCHPSFHQQKKTNYFSTQKTINRSMGQNQQNQLTTVPSGIPNCISFAKEGRHV